MSIIVINPFVFASTEFTVASLSPYGHFDASIDGSVTHVTNAVSNWANQSGSMSDLAQATAAQKPTYDDGNDKITFNGDSLIADISADTYSNTDDWDIYVVLKFTSVAQQVLSGFYSAINTAYCQEWGHASSGSTLSLYRGDGGAYDSATPAITTLTTTPKYICKLSSDSTNVYGDIGGYTGNLASTKTDVITDFVFGNRSFTADAFGLKADVHEIVVMHRALTTGEETDLRSFLTTKWSV